MKGKERAQLRAEAHHLSVGVHIGHQGLTPSVLQSLDDALRTRELVKTQVSRNADVKARDIANALALAVKAEVVQVIGRTVTLYRENPDLEWKDEQSPPWRQ
jgi:RNA-binding protein